MRKYLSLFIGLLLVISGFLFSAKSQFIIAGQNGTTLSATKTATGHLTKTFNWTIEKSVTPDTLNMFRGDSKDSSYTVTVTKDNGTDETYVDGEICVTNGGAVATENLILIDDVLYKNGSGQFQTLKSENVSTAEKPILYPGESYCYQYKIFFEPVENAHYKNSVNITITNHSGSLGTPKGPSPDADFDLQEIPTLVNDSINVDDTNGQTWAFNDSGSVNYDKTFTCNRDKGEKSNTATIRQTGQPSSAIVNVNCYDLEVSKTAETFFTRTYDWSLYKSADKTNLTLALGQTYLVNYSVVASSTGFTDSNWMVDGVIVIHNPAPITATINSVSDVMNKVISATVNCPSYTIEPYSSLECTYKKDLTDDSTLTNEATVTLQNTPETNGTTDFSGNADVSFEEAKINEVDLCANVTDTLGGVLGQVCANQSFLPFTYSYTIPGYTQCGAKKFDNTATLATVDSKTIVNSSWTVDVDVPCALSCTLTIGYWKNHSGYQKGPQKDMIAPLLITEHPIYLGSTNLISNVDIISQINCYLNKKCLRLTKASDAYLILSMMYNGGTPSNGITKLMAQLLAAKLNIASGASGTPIQTTINYADAFLANNDQNNWKILSKTNQNLVLSWMSTLDQYNNGLKGVPHCSE